jgi:hypothetical protein
VYLEQAYPSGPPPENRRQFSHLDEHLSLEEILHLKGVETLPPASSAQSRPAYALRVGNEWYPHMKVVLRPLDDDGAYIFTVDTHDHVSVPDGSPEADALRALKARNTELARLVETKWTQVGVPTQAAALREYLDRFRKEQRE